MTDTILKLNIPGASDTSLVQKDWQSVIDLMLEANASAKDAAEFSKQERETRSAKVMEAYCLTLCRLAGLPSLGKRDKDKTLIRKLLVANKVAAPKAKRLIETSSNFLTRFGNANPEMIEAAKAGQVNRLASMFKSLDINTEAQFARFVNGKEDETFAAKVVKPLLKADERGEKEEVNEALAEVIAWARASDYDVDALLMEAQE